MTRDLHADSKGSMWRPVPPPGYECLGFVAQRGRAKPNLDLIRCVRQDLAAPGTAEGEGSFIWNTEDTGDPRDFGSWHVFPKDDNGIYVGAFTGHNWNLPDDSGLFVLDGRMVERFAPSEALELAVIDQFFLTFPGEGANYWVPDRLPPEGYYLLGVYGQRGYGAPNGYSFVAREAGAGSAEEALRLYSYLDEVRIWGL